MVGEELDKRPRAREETARGAGGEDPVHGNALVPPAGIAQKQGAEHVFRVGCDRKRGSGSEERRGAGGERRWERGVRRRDMSGRA